MARAVYDFQSLTLENRDWKEAEAMSKEIIQFDDADKGLRTFSWRPNGKIFVCPVLRNESVRWSCISPRR